jgi:mono/diheme cytochrome c family protein
MNILERLSAAAVVLALAACASADATREQTVVAAGDAQRGRLLYGGQCVACHTTQAHWRDKRIVQSWPGLVAQVTRWQVNTGAGWSDTEIVDVASYLNGMFYQLECPVAGCSGRPSRAGL